MPTRYAICKKGATRIEINHEEVDFMKGEQLKNE